MNPINIKDKKFELFLSSDTIQKRVGEMARNLSIDLKDENPLFIGIMNGSFMFASDLLRQLTCNARITFLKLASYQGTQTTGIVEQLTGLNQEISGENIVILEDIIDTGLTLEHATDHLSLLSPASVKIVTLLLKPNSLCRKINIDYVGFTIPDDFIVGYGMDYEGYGRNYRDIYKITG